MYKHFVAYTHKLSDEEATTFFNNLKETQFVEFPQQAGQSIHFYSRASTGYVRKVVYKAAGRPMHISHS